MFRGEKEGHCDWLMEVIMVNGVYYSPDKVCGSELQRKRVEFNESRKKKMSRREVLPSRSQGN